MNREYQVVVVGSGPAGATVARELAKDGVDVLVLDRAIFPRYKCCGGGLTFKAAALLGDCISDIVEDSISCASLRFAGARYHDGRHGDHVMYTLSRERLDQSLAKEAEQHGAALVQGFPATSVEARASEVQIHTGSGVVRSRFVVGADGSQSVVARSLGVPAHESVVGLETEVTVNDRDLARWRSRVVVDLGWIPSGYAWLFPKADHLSIGIACRRSHAVGLKPALRRFMDSLDLGGYDTVRWRGGVIPMCVGTPRVAAGRVALVGDAAGLADPMTGEGLHNAVLSGRLAARAVEDALLHGLDDLSAYQASVEAYIMPEIRAARAFSRVLGLMPQRLLKIIGVDNRIWNAGCALIRGETTYTAIKGRVSSLGGLYSLLMRARAS